MTDDLTQGTRLGDCELLVRIGRGGMATVWVARRHGATPDEDRLVAVKVMLPELAAEPSFVRMFQDEVKLVEAIDHPNVVEVYDVGVHQGVMYMVMEWVEGDSLHSVIAEAGKRRPIPEEIAVRIIADAAAGLHAAHELRGPEGELLGVVHRDISPQNILIGTDGRVKLVDFGVAKALGRLSENTSAGQVKGKFAYMAPEQVRGGTIDRRADVFALGIVLYELTTNQRLFRGESEIETLRKVVSEPIPPPSSRIDGYPPALERIVLKALQRDVDARYATAAEFEADLRGYLREARIVVPRTGIARLLKKVMATRIEQRRRVIRRALQALETASGSGELIPDEPAFTPTGARGRHTNTGVSVVTGVSAAIPGEVSIVDAVPDGLDGWRGRAIGAVRRLERKVGGRGPLLAYVVGGASLLLGLGLTASALTAAPRSDAEPPPATGGTTTGGTSAEKTPEPERPAATGGNGATRSEEREEKGSGPRPLRLEDLDD